MVFEQICNSKWFTRTSMILFLNKIDIFQNKLRYSSVSSYFPEFKGTLDPPVLYLVLNVPLNPLYPYPSIPSTLLKFRLHSHI